MIGNIKEICYMVYQTDWKKKHGITTKKKIETTKEYLEFMKENGLDKDSYSFNDFLEEYGYDGELYACYEEFLGAEYLDHDYICSLLKTENCIAAYEEDIKM